jgi:hypothetical protein
MLLLLLDGASPVAADPLASETAQVGPWTTIEIRVFFGLMRKVAGGGVVFGLE